MNEPIQLSFRMEEAPKDYAGPKMIQLGYTMKAENKKGEIRVYGTISQYQSYYDPTSTITSRKFAEDLKKLGAVDSLDIFINTPGGNVNEAMTMRSELALHKAKNKHIMVMGMCASAGTLIACLPKKNGVRVSMLDATTYMIHNPSGICMGTASDMESCAASLHKMEENVAEVYAKRCGKDTKAIRDMMDAETEMTADEAVKNGFADDVMDEADAEDDQTTAHMQMTAEEWKAMGFHQVPERYIAMGTGNAGAEMTAQPQVSNAAPAATENKNMDTEGSKTMDMKQLQQEHPDLYNTAMAEGAKNERARLKALDEVYAPEHEKMVQEAKYGEKPVTAAELCVSLNAALRAKAEAETVANAAKGTAHMTARADETKDMKGIGPDEGKGVGGDETMEAKKTKMETTAKELAETAKQFA